VTPARQALAAWAMTECTRPRDLSARVAALAEAEGVQAATVWRSMAQVIRAGLDRRKEALRVGGYPPMAPGTTVFLTLTGPAVGQGRPRIMGGRAVGSGLSSEWGRLRAEEAWLSVREVEPAVCADDFRLLVTVYRPGARLVKPDLDNVVKLHLDALSDAGCIRDDRFCRGLTASVQDGPEEVFVALAPCP
jgi:Holliday junction resolvase RusA-like endonuclease